MTTQPLVEAVRLKTAAARERIAKDAAEWAATQAQEVQKLALEKTPALFKQAKQQIMTAAERGENSMFLNLAELDYDVAEQCHDNLKKLFEAEGFEVAPMLGRDQDGFHGNCRSIVVSW